MLYNSSSDVTRLFRINLLGQEVVEFFFNFFNFSLSEQRIIVSAPDLYKDLLHTFRHKHTVKFKSKI